MEMPKSVGMNSSATNWGSKNAGSKSKSRQGKQLPIKQSGSTGSGGGKRG